MTLPHNITIISYVQRLWRSVVQQVVTVRYYTIWHNMHLRCIICKCVHHSVCPDAMTPLIAVRNGRRRSHVLNTTSYDNIYYTCINAIYVYVIPAAPGLQERLQETQ